MDILKRILEFVFSPVGIMILLLCGGALLSILKSQSRLGRRLLLLGVFLFLLFMYSPLAEFAVARLERQYPALLKPESLGEIETVVVLSGYGEDHPEFPVTSNITGQTMCRLAEGIRIYRRLPNSKLILSGGVLRKGERSAAEIMADFLMSMGVPDSDIILERASLNTFENLVEVQKIVGVRPFILVTSACDLRRAMAVAYRLGMNPIAAPACIWALQNYPVELSWSEWARKVPEGLAYPSMKRFIYLQWAFHEYAGYVWYKLLGRV